MARRPREDVEGAIQHAFARGNNKMPVFLDDKDRQTFLTFLGVVIRRTGWICSAYCLLENHFHILVETPRANLGLGMQRLMGDYARAFNDRHNRSGHLFQGRYGSRRVTDDAQLAAVVAYIDENPVKAGLCDRAGDWPWSSAGARCKGTEPPWLHRGRLVELGQPKGV